MCSARVEPAPDRARDGPKAKERAGGVGVSVQVVKAVDEFVVVGKNDIVHLRAVIV